MNTQLKLRPLSIGLTLLAVVILSSCGSKPETPVSNGTETPTDTTQVSPAPDGAASNTKNIAASKTDKLPVPAAAQQLGVKPEGETTCPSDAPVKGKVTKKRGNIYHVPKTPNYDTTKPDICFKDKATAEKAGFRAPKASK